MHICYFYNVMLIHNFMTIKADIITLNLHLRVIVEAYSLFRAWRIQQVTFIWLIGSSRRKFPVGLPGGFPGGHGTSYLCLVDWCFCWIAHIIDNARTSYLHHHGGCNRFPRAVGSSIPIT